jgi:hypothetical protein
MSQNLRYPIGQFTAPAAASPADRDRAIERIEAAPQHLRRAVAGLSEAQLDTPYRQGGWTVRQVVHHLPDSHINAYIRFKLALTEDSPIIKTYDEALWAALPDSSLTPIECSLSMLQNLHVRWTLLLRAMDTASFARQVAHPELGTLALDTLLHLYAWHGEHHVAHITQLRERERWGR